LTDGSARAFEQQFGRRPAVQASAPGRVNLIGDHTDYNGGFVLPIATPQRTLVALAPRSDDIVRAWSANVPEQERASQYRCGAEVRSGQWIDYVAGVTASLREHGHVVPGFDLGIESTLPLGGGLSSSAALEVALLRGLSELFTLDLDGMTIAAIAHRAETGLVGAPVGVMDQMAASLADATRALFLDTRTLQFEALPLPEDCAIVVIYSGVSHQHAAGDYRIRRAECDQAARLLGVALLRDVPVEQLPALQLPPPLDRRVRHVVRENERVLQARDTLRRGDPVRLGTLMRESHASLRADFEVSTPEIDLLVDLASAQDGIFGARITGGGFGGSIVALARRDAARSAADCIASAYAARVPERPAILIP
jgi:galactokinase